MNNIVNIIIRQLKAISTEIVSTEWILPGQWPKHVFHLVSVRLSFCASRWIYSRLGHTNINNLSTKPIIIIIIINKKKKKMKKYEQCNIHWIYVGYILDTYWIYMQIFVSWPKIYIFLLFFPMMSIQRWFSSNVLELAECFG